MGNPYVGEIRIFAGTFAPLNWHFCDGTLIAISENPTLFQLIGTTYGGNGTTTFALPNLLSRLPVHQGTASFGTFVLGQSAGVETVTLSLQEMPAHTHTLMSATAGQVQAPSGNVIPALATSGATGSINVYSAGPPVSGENIHPNTIGPAGGSQPHSNIQPYVAVNYIISLFGIFPTQS